MRRLLSILSFLLFSLAAFSQTSERKYEYAILKVEDRFHGLKINYADGTEEDYLALKGLTMEKVPFSNNKIIVDALNYMDEKGYVLVSTYTEGVAGTTYTVEYVFKKEVKK